MNPKWLLAPALLAVSSVATAQTTAKSSVKTSKTTSQSRPEDVLKNAAGARVEIVFALDTTGSMGGLIEGAKRKIWSIVSAISTARPAPQVRIGFVAYRDKGDDYVTQVHDFSDDLDSAFATLNTFNARGGGDEPEHVNQALHDSVARLKWSDSRQYGGSLYQVIFLVGDAPPHDDYADGPDGKASIQSALARGITLNAIQCGSIASTAPKWQEFARLGEGKYFAIAQEGGMTAIATPYDVAISKISDEIEGTTLARAGSVMQYGRRTTALEARAKSARANAALPAASKADRALFNSNSAQVYGAWDLTTQAMNGQIKTADLAKMKEADLPPELKKLPASERPKYLQAKIRQRSIAQKKLSELQKKRSAFIQAAMTKAGKSDKDAFDGLVKSTMREQAARRKIVWK